MSSKQLVDIPGDVRDAMGKEIKHMATTRPLNSSSATTKRQAKSIAREIFSMMEKKFDQMTPDQEREKHRKVRAILDRGAKK